MAALEFALLIPFLLLMFLGLIEMSRLILVTQKAEKVATTIADITAQATSMSTSELNLILGATGNLMAPYRFTTNGVVIVTSVSKTGTNPPKVRWQHRGGGTKTATSLIGAVGANATLPTGLTLDDKDNIVIAEVFYTYTPIMGTYILGERNIYKTAYYRPRLGALETLN